MKRRTSLSSIFALAGAIVLAGWGMAFVAPAMAQKKAAPVAASGGQLNERIRQLEERIQDLQAVIGTLQSFVRDGAAAPAPGGFPPAGGQPAGSVGGGPNEVSIRVLALETQIRALTGQMAQITERLTRIESGAGAQPFGSTPQSLPQGGQLGDPFANSPASPQVLGQPAVPAAPAQAPVPQFGTTATPPQTANPFDQLPLHRAAPGAGAQPLPQLSGSLGGEGPRAMYEASYQNFLRNDFNAAEKGFRSFLATYPADRLTGNAQYWLGRTHFERKQYEPAAKAFLEGYKKDKKGAIAPDALLHLGLSLAKLGEKEASCSTLKAIPRQFPDAPGKLKQDTKAAIKRGRC